MQDVRLGVSMREIFPAGSVEPRDALAQNWGCWLSSALPEISWMPLPNVGASIIAHVERWGVNALILSGGDDFGSSPLRDSTEMVLLKWAIEKNIPVIGVCRGAQLVWSFLGGGLVMKDGHVASRHYITWTAAALKYGLNGEVEVPSYHKWALDTKASNVVFLAKDHEDSVEAFEHESMRLLGVMWHPERDVVFSSQNEHLFRMYLKKGTT